MRRTFLLGVALILLSLGASAEATTAESWAEKHLAGTVEALPFTFIYDGKPSSELLRTWTFHKSSDNSDPNVNQWFLRSSGFLDCMVKSYQEIQAVEWSISLVDHNPGVFEKFCSADFTLDVPEGTHCVLHYSEGSHERITDFQPMQMTLELNKEQRFFPYGGRPSDGYLPFFNLQTGNGGVIIAIGWTGQWQASFTRGSKGVRITAGLEAARFKLPVSTSYQMPSVLVLFWNGDDYIVGQNQFRKLLLKHYVPQYDKKPVPPFTAASPHAAIPFEKTTEANMLEAIANISAHKMPIDYYWIDAGWFTCPGGNWARGVGNFQPDPERFPRGLKPVADAAHNAGMKFLLWFEPERVMPDTQLFKEHPEWLIRPSEPMPIPLKYQVKDNFNLLNLGDPSASGWLGGAMRDFIRNVGIDAYRNDFNMYPLSYWRNGQPADETGTAEIRYVNGLYRYFDSLRADNPNLLLDTCASGGRRIDLEMVKRALILTRSDYLWDPIGQQCHTYGLSRWLPITGIGAAEVDDYKCRSGYGSHFCLAMDYYSNDEKLWDHAHRLLAECKSLAPLYRGDFYPLTDYSTADNVWMAWQYHLAEQGEGLVQAFRRQNADEETRTFQIKGLEADKAYELTNLDTQAKVKLTGKELAKQGVTVSLSQKPSAGILRYKACR